jgi:hypothetical protein
VSAQNLGFIPLHGERDEESQFGVPIPYKGWILDVDSFGTRAKNYFDHNNIGNSHSRSRLKERSYVVGN